MLTFALTMSMQHSRWWIFIQSIYTNCTAVGCRVFLQLWVRVHMTQPRTRLDSTPTLHKYPPRVPIVGGPTRTRPRLQFESRLSSFSDRLTWLPKFVVQVGQHKTTRQTSSITNLAVCDATVRHLHFLLLESSFTSEQWTPILIPCGDWLPLFGFAVFHF